ncbi:glycosyltransferase [Bifidobacterium sp. UTBIF-78]|uniref:glycosyltransferase family protein n=1 Tax=Bifidobacterium sp. UTBIF-78 TaxID=1465263 RepID=UPI001126D714|nr:glycosyltransferase [Bifidobacterium sp. UTBIF-78]TPF95430.1 hypothetical protein BG22_01905 [Bifidobacterium sp. UTBIF-78]
MGKAILIYNWKAGTNETFPSYLRDHGVSCEILDNPDDGTRRLSKWYKIVNSLECAALAFRAVLRARKGDVIVAMCATPGILASILNWKRVPVVVVNLLCHSSERPGAGERMRNRLYSHALNRPGAWATCNALNDMPRYRRMFSLRQPEHLVHLLDGVRMDDAVATAAEPVYDVFSCGASARDWDTLVAAARLLPEVRFHVVARQDDWKPEYADATNVRVDFNLPHDEYLHALNDSRMTVLPLNSPVTAGLLVMFDSVKYGRPVVMTRTASTEQFVPASLHDRTLVPMGDAPALADAIRATLSLSDEERAALVAEGHEYLRVNHSEESRHRRLLGIIRKALR